MVDAVITWVNGDDPEHKRKRDRYITSQREDKMDGVAGDTRYMSRGEIFLCVASILRFAPFFRKIFIVTDNQNPHLDDFVNTNFPDRTTEIEIVSHSDVFKGYEGYLPTFNSRSIETMLYRIPGLSDRFVYFNDDVFLLRPIMEKDWFEGDASIVYAHKFPVFAARFLQKAKKRLLGKLAVGYKDGMLNSAEIAGSDFFLYAQHSPWALKKSWYERFYNGREDLIIRNLSHKFRNPEQFNPQALYVTQAYREGTVIVKKDDKVSLFIKMERKDREAELDKKIKRASSNSNFRFACISSLDKAPDKVVRKFYAWAGEVIGVDFTSVGQIGKF